MVDSTLEISKLISLDYWDNEAREGWSNSFVDQLIPSGSFVTGLILSGGQVIERIYLTPAGETLSVRMDHASVFM